MNNSENTITNIHTKSSKITVQVKNLKKSPTNYLNIPLPTLFILFPINITSIPTLLTLLPTHYILCPMLFTSCPANIILVPTHVTLLPTLSPALPTNIISIPTLVTLLPTNIIPFPILFSVLPTNIILRPTLFPPLPISFSLPLIFYILLPIYHISLIMLIFNFFLLITWGCISPSSFNHYESQTWYSPSLSCFYCCNSLDFCRRDAFDERSCFFTGGLAEPYFEANIQCGWRCFVLLFSLYQNFRKTYP